MRKPIYYKKEPDGRVTCADCGGFDEAHYTTCEDIRRGRVTKTSLLAAAKDAVADRGLNYGKPEANFDRIANLWQAHFANCGKDVSISAADVAQMMVLMKIARLENSPAHLDSWTDIAGYAACGAEITNGEQKEA